MMWRTHLLLFSILFPCFGHAAPLFSFSFGSETVAGGTFQLLALATFISLSPSLLIAVTSFTRIIIVLSMLRTAIGIGQSPPNSVLIGLSLFMTFFVMHAPLNEIYKEALLPFSQHEISQEVALQRATIPLRNFLLSNTNIADIELFIKFIDKRPANIQSIPMYALVPAFMISELQHAFQIGFLIFLPFLLIDLAISMFLMSLGIMMLPPTMIALPFKIIFFVMVDGWNLITEALLKSFLHP